MKIQCFKCGTEQNVKVPPNETQCKDCDHDFKRGGWRKIGFEEDDTISTDAPWKKSLEDSPYDWFVLFLLCLFLGGLGIHRFYVRKTTSGLLYLLTLGFLGVGAIIDLFTILSGNFEDDLGRIIKK